MGVFIAGSQPDHLGLGVVPATGAGGGAGRRAASLIRSSSATSTQLATSDEPP